MTDAELERRVAISPGLARLTLALTVFMASGAFPAFALGVLSPLVIDEFRLSRAELGLITTAMYLVGGLASISAGSIVDRAGPRRVIVGAFGMTAVTLACMAVAPAFPFLVALAGVAGVAMAAGNPATNKVVASVVPSPYRGTVIGVKQAGVQLGVFGAGAALPAIAAGGGWRAAIAASIFVPALGLLVTPRSIDAPPSAGAGHPNRETSGLSTGLVALTAYAFLMGGGVSATMAFLPLYLVEARGASLAFAGLIAALIGLTAIIFRITWGLWSARLSSYGLALAALAAGSIVSVLVILAIGSIGIALAVPAALLFGATASTWNSLGMLAAIDASGSARAGRATGRVLLGFYFGFVVAPLGFGAIVDSTGTYIPAWLAVAALFGLATGVAATVRPRT
jgi:sugar phosphate permease